MWSWNDARLRRQHAHPSHQTRLGLALSVVLLCAPTLSVAETRLDAILHWATRVELSTPLSGLVREVLVANGETVKKGQVLLRLDTRPYDYQKQAAQARIQRAKAQLDEAQREMARVQTLHDQVLIANHELEVTKTALLAAQAEQADALADVKQAELHLDYAQLRAPFSGRIVARQIEAGEIVSNQCQVKPLLVLVDDNRLVARAWVDATQAAALKLGQSASVEHSGQQYAGKITHIDWEASPQTGLLAVEVSVQAPLRAGLSANVVIE